MAAKSNLLNMVLCLFGVCLVCAAILGAVYVVTEDPIQQASKKALEESIGKVLPQGGELSEAMESDGFQYYESVDGGSVAAYAVKSTVIGFGGPLTIMVGVLPDGTVYNTSVLSHSETPGLGAKCTTDDGFISQWKGFKGRFAVRKDGGDVDAITASTITSRAYTLAVANAVEFVKGIAPEVEEVPQEEEIAAEATEITEE